MAKKTKNQIQYDEPVNLARCIRRPTNTGHISQYLDVFHSRSASIENIQVHDILDWTI